MAAKSFVIGKDMNLHPSDTYSFLANTLRPTGDITTLGRVTGHLVLAEISSELKTVPTHDQLSTILDNFAGVVQPPFSDSEYRDFASGGHDVRDFYTTESNQAIHEELARQLHTEGAQI
jgi:hypothetical protein